MPRIHPKHFARARVINKALPRLLPVCRDLSSARNELRWLQEHAIDLSRQTGGHNHEGILKGFLSRRANGEPLQYILGSEYFGDIEIKCRPGVLIPRPETAASVSHLASLIKPDISSPLRILDLCTGSGCIPLLFHHELYRHHPTTKTLQIVGVDISTTALSLARENLIHQIATQSRYDTQSPEAMRSLHGIGFVQADILHKETSEISLDQALTRVSSNTDRPKFDILISNPPYISSKAFSTISRSVKAYEPKLALVPPQQTAETAHNDGDIFYPRLLDIAEQVEAKTVLFEVSDMDQAKRVIALAAEHDTWGGLEIWRDSPSDGSSGDLTVGERVVKVRGSGQGRSIFLYREDADTLLNVD